jgi:YndJ-like protein
MIRNAIAGGILWAALVACAIFGWFRVGLIDVLLLLGPLVVVPLGLELSTRDASNDNVRSPVHIAKWIHCISALLVVGSFCFPQGATAAIFAVPWLCFGSLLGLWGLARFATERTKSLQTICLTVSFCYSPVGGAWLVASRYGINPMGFQEPIVLLTAVHFHFAGFAAPLLTRAAARVVQKGTALTRRLFRIVAAGVLAGPGLLAAGFVIGPRLKLAAALLLVISEMGLSVFFLIARRTMRPRLAQMFVALSAASVLFAMFFAGAWAIGEYPLQPFVHLAQMAEFHGTANALGFTLCGLLG